MQSSDQIPAPAQKSREEKAEDRRRSAGRILRSDSEALLWVIACAVSLVILFSFALSFSSQVQLAIAARISPLVAWGLPLIVDGTILVATFGTLILHPRGRGPSAYAWFILTLFGAVSIYSNAIHATGKDLSEMEASIIGAVPAIALLASMHLLVLMLTSPKRVATDAEKAAAEKTDEVVKAPALPADDPAGATEPVRGSSVAAPADQRPALKPRRRGASDEPSISQQEAADMIAKYVEEHGEVPSRKQVAAWIGKSTKTAGRWLEALGYSSSEVNFSEALEPEAAS